MSVSTKRSVVQGIIVPGLPQPLLVPEQNPGWQRLRDGFEAARKEIEALNPDLILVYSTMWPSVIGHQIQADPKPKWVHVDELFHDLGSIPYEFDIDADFAQACLKHAKQRGLQARTVNYYGFPIDTGSVVALKLLNPNNKFKACIVSSNVYSDRAESLVFAKAAASALEEQGKRAVAVTVMTLSNRLFTEFIDPKDDRIHSQKDDEWNRKILEFLGDGRLEDVAQLSREIHKQIRIRKVVNFKPMWWLSGLMGTHNNYHGKVHAYEALYGTGGAVVTLTPSESSVGDKEYDEDDVEYYRGDRNVLGGVEGREAQRRGSSPAKPAVAPVAEPTTTPPAAKASADKGPSGKDIIKTSAAPKPVGAYPHARRVGQLLTISGMGPRQPGTDAIPGGPIVDEHGQPRDYDAAAQTRAVIENIRAVLQSVGLDLEHIVDVTSFLIDMKRDFPAYNKVYAEYFEGIQATRTTVAITALPTPIAVELKVVAQFPEGS